MSKTRVPLHGKKKEGAGKVGSNEYDSDVSNLHADLRLLTKVSPSPYPSQVYRRAIVDNAANLSAQKHRNWGTGNILVSNVLQLCTSDAFCSVSVVAGSVALRALTQ
jgi:hypothetical protein